MVSWSVCSSLVVFCSALVVFCSAVLVFYFVCSGLVVLCSAVELFCSVYSALVGSCSVCSAVEVFCSVCSAVEVSAPSAPPWWSSVLLWWSSAPPWGSSGPSALLWWFSTPPVLPAPSWSPVLPVLPQSQGLTPLHGPGPPSLPLFRLRSTTLLDCVMFGASGSRSLGWGGALSWIRSMDFHLLATRGHSSITLTFTLHRLLHITLDYISQQPFH